MKLRSVNCCLVVFIAFVVAPAVFGQASRTWVSGVGDDANPCSRTAPCKTFAGAYSKTAAGGEIDVLDPGGFGAVTISKALTIDGSGGSIAGVLVQGTNGIVVQAGINDVVTLRNLDINGLNTPGLPSVNGIRLISAAALHVENCLIYQFQKGLSLESNVPNTLVSIRNTSVRQNSNIGLYSAPSGGGTIQLAVNQSHFDGNGFAGIDLTNNTQGVISSSTINGNTTGGLIAETSTINVALLDATVSGNNYGVAAGATSGAVVRLSHCVISANNFGVSFANTAQVIGYGNNIINGNASGLNAPSSTIAAQ